MPRFINDKLRYKRGKPIAFDDRGWPIFGYNGEGKPCCFSKKADGSRCMSVIRFANGRCKMHGGTLATKNIMASGSFRKKLYEGKLPKDLGLILADAVEDPEAHSLKEELAVNTVQISKLLGAIGRHKDEADEATWKEVQKLAEEAEKLLFDDGVQSIFALGGEGHKVSKLANTLEKLVLRIRAGADESKLFKEINEATEYRRRLVETDMKRVQMARNMIPAAEALQMFKNIVSLVKTIFYKDTEGLRTLAQKLDASSLTMALKYQDNSLGAKITPGAFVDPTSEVGNDLRDLAEKSELKVEPIEDISEYDGEGTLEHPYPGDKPSAGNDATRKPKNDATLERRKARQMMESGGQEKGFVRNDRPIPKKIKFD